MFTELLNNKMDTFSKFCWNA